MRNAFGSALWAIDFLFDNAENGSGGVNFHGGGAGQDGASPFMYTPIDEVNGVVTGAAPIFYGMLLVASAGTGNVLATMADASNLNFTAYAISLPDGSTNVVLDNKDTTNAVQASVNIGKAATAASGVFLNGPSLLATSGVTSPRRRLGGLQSERAVSAGGELLEITTTQNRRGAGIVPRIGCFDREH